MTNNPDTQYQPRTNTLTYVDVLEQLPSVFDIQSLTSEQKLLLSDFNRHLSTVRLLQDIQTECLAAVKQMQQREASIRAQISEEYLAMSEIAHSATMYPVVNMGARALLAEERKKEEALLAEWRKKKYGAR